LPDAWIVNASPSIILGRIGRLELLDALSSKVGVPAAVIDEVRAGLADDPRAAASMPFTDMAGRGELPCVGDDFQRRALKNALSWLPHSSPSTPPVTSMR
jgi:hypothetical protein